MADPTGIEIRAPWRPLNDETVAQLPAGLGVYEIAREGGATVALDYAGAHSNFGLRGEVARAADRFEGPLLFRAEATHAYISRLKELTELPRLRKGEKDGSGAH